MAKDYKKTLNMPNTGFEMKASLKDKEPVIQRQWAELGLCRLILAKNKEAKKWTLHDGPPYANGSIHIGHALNKILKDIIVRHKALQGYYCEYIPGWDTHGLPIEHALLKQEPDLLKRLSVADFRKRCGEFAEKNIANQIVQFKRLGLGTDFAKIYKTLDKQFEADQIAVFKKMVEKQVVYKGLKPVYWSPSSQSALAEAEIEYADKSDRFVYVTMPLVKTKGTLPEGTKLMIWTTTAWTIPSNRAVCANPDLDYVQVQADGSSYVVAAARVPALANELKWNDYKTVKTIKGVQLEHMTYADPLYGEERPVLVDGYVLAEEGTGLVHNAPGHGPEDYVVCKRYGIEPFCPIDANGKFTDELKDETLSGMTYEASVEKIIARLKDKGRIALDGVLTHSVAHDWRTKKPIIYRATSQWFVDLAHQKDAIINALNKVTSHPSWAVDRMKQMIARRGEWCISRQRTWGVPITVIYGEDEKPILDGKIFDKVIKYVQEEGTNAWYLRPVTDFLPDGYDLTKKYTKDKDIMDVWFDSGTTYTVLARNGLPMPADMYLEGGDQFRGWFNSSLITSVIAGGMAPYKELLAHGFTLDEHGNKMSKSVGNVVDPLSVCAEYGADVLRLWVATSDYVSDQRIGPSILKQTGELYRKIRNSIFRFCLSNLSDFDPSSDERQAETWADKCILTMLHDTATKVDAAFADYDYIKAVTSMNSLLTTLSTWYFEVVKDALYCDKPDSERRRQVQTVLSKILETYVVALAPIMPHTCEEAHSFIKRSDKAKSVHLEDWLAPELIPQYPGDAEMFADFTSVKNETYRQIELARDEGKMGRSAEAAVQLVLPKEFAGAEWTGFDWKTNMNVASVSVTHGTKLAVTVVKSDGAKCDRCWNYFAKEEMANEETCQRCAAAIAGLPRAS